MSDFFPSASKKPRDYAHDIAKLKTREERRAALEKVPPIMQGIVKTHVTNTLSLVKHWQRRIEADPLCRIPECVHDLLEEYGD